MNVDCAAAHERAHPGRRDAFDEAPGEETVGRAGPPPLCCDGTTAGCCWCVFAWLISLKAEVRAMRQARGAGCDGDSAN